MKNTNNYQRGKERAREAAIDWQYNTLGEAISYGELSEAGDRFCNLGRRYGLLREFRTNGIPC